MLCKLLNRVAAVQEHTFFTIDVGDFRLTGSGRGESGVKREMPLSRQFCYIDNVGALGAFVDRQIDIECRIVALWNREFCRLACH